MAALITWRRCCWETKYCMWNTCCVWNTALLFQCCESKLLKDAPNISIWFICEQSRLCEDSHILTSLTSSCKCWVFLHALVCLVLGPIKAISAVECLENVAKSASQRFEFKTYRLQPKPGYLKSKLWEVLFRISLQLFVARSASYRNQIFICTALEIVR